MGSSSDWQSAFEAFVAPFLAGLARAEQRHWAPLYLQGLLGPGERKSIEPMAARVAPGSVQQLHHFVAASPWPLGPLAEELVRAADRLVGGRQAVLVIDDTALVKQGRCSVGVKHQYCGQLGKQANCQALVSLTLARAEVPVAVGLRLFLPEDWAADAGRRARVGVPKDVAWAPKWQIALDELDRIVAAGARFALVLADAEYGKSAEFRSGLEARGRSYAVGIDPRQHVYPPEVTIAPPGRGPTNRPRKHPAPSLASQSLEARFADQSFATIAWRTGRKGRLAGAFAAARVRVADGEALASGRHLPGSEVWAVCECRANERKYYLSNLPPDTPLARLAGAIKARWVCEQMHQQMKEELGLDHFEGRSWTGLHHHTLLTMIAFAFLQHLRLGGKNQTRHWAAPAAQPARSAPPARGRARRLHATLPALPQTRALQPAPLKMAE